MAFVTLIIDQHAFVLFLVLNYYSYSALTLVFVLQEGHLACEKSRFSDAQSLKDYRCRTQPSLE